MTPTAAAKALIAELEQEAISTRKVLERVPEDRLTWRPHARSMTIGQLAQHVAGIPGHISKLASGDGFDTAAANPEPAHPESGQAILRRLDQSVADAKTFLSGLDEQSAVAPWRLTHKDNEVFTLPRLGVVRTMMLNHWYHHRGQLTVYLRMLDIPVPVVYGRSADEGFGTRAAS